MATLFFVRDGRGDSSTSSGHKVHFATAKSLQTKYSTKFFATGPTINQGVASLNAAYKYVVIQIDKEEECEEFPSLGFYYFLGLGVSDAQQVFAIRNP